MKKIMVMAACLVMIAGFLWLGLWPSHLSLMRQPVAAPSATVERKIGFYYLKSGANGLICVRASTNWGDGDLEVFCSLDVDQAMGLMRQLQPQPQPNSNSHQREAANSK